MHSKRDPVRVPLSVLRSFCEEVLTVVGVPAQDAALVARSLVQADARELSSHGVVRLLPVYVKRLQMGTTRARPRIRVVRQMGAVALMDGDAGLGQVVGSQAMTKAIELASQLGVSLVAVRDSSHFGTAAFFVEQAIEVDMVGLAMTNAPSNMPPWGGRRKFFGTNPFAVGIPCGEERPVVLDMSTSVVARGKIVMAYKAGECIPPDWAIDAEGRPTQDPAAALEGAVLPLGGYKGAGLALVIDALCGVLSGAAFASHIVDLYDQGDRVQNVGHLFAALQIEAVMSTVEFKARMDQFVREVRAQPRMPGVDRIYVPGEPEFEHEVCSTVKGVPLPEAGWAELDALAAELNVSPLRDRVPLEAS